MPSRSGWSLSVSSGLASVETGALSLGSQQSDSFQKHMCSTRSLTEISFLSYRHAWQPFSLKRPFKRRNSKRDIQMREK